MKTPISLLLGGILLASCSSPLPASNLDSNTAALMNMNSNVSVATNLNQNATSIEQVFREIVSKLDTEVKLPRGNPEDSSVTWHDKDDISLAYEVRGMQVFYPESKEDAFAQYTTFANVLESMGFVKTPYQSDGGPGSASGLQKDNVGCLIQSMNAGARELSQLDKPYTQEDYANRGDETTILCAFVK